MAQAKCVAADLKAVGGLAREFESVSKAAASAVGEAGKAGDSARAAMMQSVRALDDLHLYWSGNFGVQGVDLRTVGDGLVATANAFAHGDATGAGEFAHATRQMPAREVDLS